MRRSPIIFAAAAAAALAVAAPAGAQGCTACADFVTTYDPDRSGPVAATTRMHEDLTANVAYALDVDGTLPPLPLGSVPTAPGYEVRATVAALDAEKPTITIERLSTAVADLPLRIEIVRPDGARFKTFGYDSLATSAPQSFRAAIDLSNRDGAADTDQALVDMKIAGAAGKLTVVNEEFGGDPAGARSARQIRRLEFFGDGSLTRVPSTLTLDMTTAAKRQRVVLTRDARTKLNVELVEPNGSRTTSTIDELPSRIDVTVADVDLNGDGKADKKIDYSSTAVASKFVFKTQSGSEVTDATVTNLPAVVHLTRVSQPGKTLVTYHASGRAKRVLLNTTSGTRKLAADVANLPANIDELSQTTRTDGTDVVYHSDARADSATVEVTEGTRRTKAKLTSLPSRVDLIHRASASDGHVDLVANGVTGSADVDLVDAKGQTTKLLLVSVPAEVHVDFARIGDRFDFDYNASSELLTADVRMGNIGGGTAKADDPKTLRLIATRVPTNIAVDKSTSKTTSTKYEVACTAGKPNCEIKPDCDYEQPVLEPECQIARDEITTTRETTSVAVTTPDVAGQPVTGRIGGADFRLASGAELLLPATGPNGKPQDGLRMNDIDGTELALNARVTELNDISFTKFSEEIRTCCVNHRFDGTERMNVKLNGLPVAHALAVDVSKREAGQSSTHRTKGFLATLPGNFEATSLEQKNPQFNITKFNYLGAAAVNGFTRADGTRAPGFELTESVSGGSATGDTKRLKLDPMPQAFNVCKLNRGTSCSEGRFNANITRLRDVYGMPVSPTEANKGSLLITASPATDLEFEEPPLGTKTSFSKLKLTDLAVYGLQAHKVDFTCGGIAFGCKKGYVAMDSGNMALPGDLENLDGVDGKRTKFHFPGGWKADRHAWAFEKTSPASGGVAMVGPITCPSGTSIVASGETITDRFCHGALLGE